MRYIAPIAAVLLVAAGSIFFDDRRYYFISLAIVIALLAPMVLRFEHISVRYMVLIAALGALAAVSRAAFAPLEQFKPTASIVIVSGICLGAEGGFAVGALSMFASNMYFSQGPWTPWQMLAMGMVGFISGALFARRRPGRTVLALYGFAVTVLVYGVIADLSTVVMTYDRPTLTQVISTLYLGLFFNIIHGVSSLVFLLAIGGRFIKRLDRLVIKYGIGGEGNAANCN